MAIPNDPFILLSYINAQLRDFYPSLDSFCEDKGADKKEITQKLSAVGYEYSEELNSFI